MIDPKTALAGLPTALRDELLEEYREVVRNFREGRWTTAELHGGRFAEVAYCVAKGAVDGTYPPSTTKPPNMVDACRKLEGASSGSRAMRILVPRTLPVLYEIRNNRNVGHVGGGVDPSRMDAAVVTALVKWVLAEFVREYHSLAPGDATEVVEALVDREAQVVWEVAGRRRVLDTTMTRKDKVLALLYANAGPVHEETVAAWMEEPRQAYFRRDVLRPLHGVRMVEFDESTGLVHLSPLGTTHIEARLV